jgi:hypothetical protein
LRENHAIRVKISRINSGSLITKRVFYWHFAKNAGGIINAGPENRCQTP